MSWDTYVETLKSYSVSGAIGEAIIVSRDNGGLWSSPTTKLTALDAKALGQIKGKTPESLTINGEKYMFLRVVEDEDDSSYQILYKKKEVGSLCVSVTGQTIIVSFVPDSHNHSAGEANEATKKIAAYLMSLGY